MRRRPAWISAAKWLTNICGELPPIVETIVSRGSMPSAMLAAPADDEPERFEPEADDLEAIGEELRLVAAAIRGADREHAFLGVNDPDVCRWCEFRAICPDSATPADTTWPSPLTEDV
jgi:hypothetical protein